MTRTLSTILAACALVAGCATTHTALSGAPLATGEAARAQVTATERAFAKTMHDRDLKAFTSYLSEEAVFFAGGKALHGKQAVTDFWTKFYARPEAPFSWEPAVVEVLASGSLGLSSGPVHDAQGKLIGCFSSIWRQEAAGQW